MKTHPIDWEVIFRLNSSHHLKKWILLRQRNFFRNFENFVDCLLNKTLFPGFFVGSPKEDFFIRFFWLSYPQLSKSCFTLFPSQHSIISHLRPAPSSKHWNLHPFFFFFFLNLHLVRWPSYIKTFLVLRGTVYTKLQCINLKEELKRLVLRFTHNWRFYHIFHLLWIATTLHLLY
jgi:hypothetical protein